MLYIVLTIQTILELLIIIVSAIFVVAVMIFVQNQCENCRQKKRLRQITEANIKYLQYKREQKLRKKEREKYPLFYWRELIEEKLEDGNF